MNYSIEVEEQVADRLRQAPPELAARIVDQIDRIAQNPSLGGRVSEGPLTGSLLYTFVVEQDPRVLRLGLLYRDGKVQHSLVITDLGFLEGDGARMRISECWPLRERDLNRK